MITGLILLFWCGISFGRSLPIQSTDCSTRGFDHPLYGWKYCSDYCTENRSSRGQIEFCTNVCPNYYVDCHIDLNIQSSTTTTSTTLDQTADRLPTFLPSFASSHISSTTAVEAVSSKPTEETNLEEQSTILDEVDKLKARPDRSNLNPILVGLSVIVLCALVVVGICFACLKKKRRERIITNCGRPIFVTPRRKSNRLHVQDTRRFDENEYYQGLLPSMSSQPGFQHNRP